MAENGKPKIDVLLWWLAIATIGSLAILFLSAIYIINWVPMESWGFFLIGLLIRIILWIGLISTTWSLWQKGMRSKAKTWSFVSFVISIGLLPLSYIDRYLSLN